MYQYGCQAVYNCQKKEKKLINSGKMKKLQKNLKIYGQREKQEPNEQHNNYMVRPKYLKLDIICFNQSHVYEYKS